MADSIGQKVEVESDSEVEEKNLKQMDSLELMTDETNPSPTSECFTEDYSVREATLIDEEIAKLPSTPVVDEFYVLENEWEHPQQPTEEFAEEILERLELEALIKRAEDKLLPEEATQESQILPKDDALNRMESSDFSEDEGYQQRLSCILEETESDASGSCVTSKTANKILQPCGEILSEIVDEETSQDCEKGIELVYPLMNCEIEPTVEFEGNRKISKRGRSAEPRSKPDFGDNVSITSEKLMKLPKLKTNRRGRSLESGLEEKRQTNQPDSGEKRPPVPPETYLWEELRRWRIKGGYPWTHLDKPPYDEKAWKIQMDHEYEPINPPPLQKQPSTESGGIIEDEQQTRESGQILGLLRIPNDDQLVISAEDMEVEAIDAAREFQSDVEDRFLATSMTGTTASRTDCDVNTSMLDSSGLEDLPLKRDSRSKKSMQLKTEQMRLQAQGLHQRIRTQAGKLRNKLRNLPRPSFQRKEKEKKPDGEDKPRFRLPDRPKFTLPERARFKMPQKPKINLPSFSKPLREKNDEPKKNIFDLDFKTYPRMFNKKSKDRGDYATSSPKQARSATPPPPRPIQPARKKVAVGQRWVNRFDDIRFVDERASEPSHRSDRSESLSDFHDKDFAIGDDDLENIQLPPARTLSTKSSISHISQSSRSSEDPHRKGVIEEIDSDQFFLRQKGISEENIDMGNYLSQEIREAFRAPAVNALQQLDLDYQETQDSRAKHTESVEPQAPARTRSLKRMKHVGSLEQNTAENEDNVNATASARYENQEDDNFSEYYKSPPPPQEYLHYKVPRRTGKRKHSSADESGKQKTSPEWVQVDIETSLELTMPEEVNEPEYIIPEQAAPDVPKRTRSLSRGSRSVTREKRDETKTPIAPKRSSSKSLHSLNLKNDRFRRDPDSYSVQSLKLTESSTLGRPSKKGSYSSFTEESKTLPKARSRRYQSLATGVNSWAPKPPERTRSQTSVSAKNQYQVVSEDGYAGYAVVEKTKPARPPPPRRRKASPSPDFNTFPRSQPQPARPVRNYATLGPSRPPRKFKPEPIRTQSLEHIYAEGSVIDSHGSNKDLQATDVVEKMKVRPLPAPPRPPRVKSKSEENNASIEIVEEVCVSTQTDPLPDDLCLEDDIIQEFSHEQIKLQYEFLQEMRDEEDRIRREMEAKRARYLEQDAQIDEDSAKVIAAQLIDDLGYASLDRRQTVSNDEEIEPMPSTSRAFQETTSSYERPNREQEKQILVPSGPQQPIYVPLIPSVLTSDTLRVVNLEVDQLRVNHLETNTIAVGELSARQILVQDVRGTNLAIQEINSNTGQLNLENIEIPPEIIQQIIARIPWEELVSSRTTPQQPLTTVAPQTEENVAHSLPNRRRRKQLARSQASSDDDSAVKRPLSPRRSHRAVAVVEQPNISNLSRQLAVACTDAGLGAFRQLTNNVGSFPIITEPRYLQAMVVFAVVAIAGYVLLCLHARDVHHHHWDFQFPPQPPRQ